MCSPLKNDLPNHRLTMPCAAHRAQKSNASPQTSPIKPVVQEPRGIMSLVRRYPAVEMKQPRVNFMLFAYPILHTSTKPIKNRSVGPILHVSQLRSRPSERFA